MEIVAVSDIHSNLVPNGWKTLEALLRENESILAVNLGDTVGADNLRFVSMVKDYVAVPGNHDIEEAVGEVIQMRKKKGAPFQYWMRFYEEKTWRVLEKWGYGSNLPLRKHLCYYLFPMEEVCFIFSHIPIRRDDALYDLIPEMRKRGIKYIYNLYGHTHSRRLKITREKVGGMYLISVHLPPFYLYGCAWNITFEGKTVRIKEMYFDEDGFNSVEVKREAKKGIFLE